MSASSAVKRRVGEDVGELITWAESALGQNDTVQLEQAISGPGMMEIIERCIYTSPFTLLQSSRSR
jgi:hypothetical protein